MSEQLAELSTKDWERALRMRIDEKFEREVNSDDAIARLERGELSHADAAAWYRGLWDSIMVFNRVLLPRILETAPDLATRVQLMGVIAPEFGNHIDDAHPVLFRNFLEAMGFPISELPMTTDIERGPAADEARETRGFSFAQAVARLLVGESIAPVTFVMVANRLRKSFGLSDYDVTYFTFHAAHDRKDTELLIDISARLLNTEEERRQFFDTIDAYFDRGRYISYGAKLNDTTEYRYERRFDRRRRPGETI